MNFVKERYDLTVMPADYMNRLSTLLAVSVALWFPFCTPAATVNTLADSGPGSLRAAVAAGGAINFSVAGTIALTSGEITINSPVTINGPGANQLALQRSPVTGRPEFRLFTERSTE